MLPLQHKKREAGSTNTFHLEVSYLKDYVSKSPCETHPTRYKNSETELKSLQQFYEIFTTELEKPVSNRLLDFSKSKLDNTVKCAIVLCTRQPQFDLVDNQAFHTEIISEANGHYGQPFFSEFNLSAIKDNQLVFRIFQFTDSKALVFFWARHYDQFYKKLFQMANSSLTFKVNHFGSTLIDCPSLFDLDQKTIYLLSNGCNS